ncbi:MAG: protease Lon-related BREX system protein BrxL, partial [Chloroflexi bacterium]|nr:protease Lon-related BREX system protein BrxL [Chloroflexota bacterium]
MTQQLDPIDIIATKVFEGYVVRKDLVRKFKGQYPVPTYVAEFLLGRYCATTDEEEIREGGKIVERQLSEKSVRAGEHELFKARAREEGSVRIIDLITARLDSKTDAYVATLPSLQLNQIRISPQLVKDNDRMLTGGFYTEVTLSYDGAIAQEKGGRPFAIDSIKAIQFSKSDALETFLKARSQFTTQEWKQLLLRSIGLEPKAFSERAQMVTLLRMVSFVERNYNMVELGPRGTGKSYAYQELSPYSILMTGPTTVANLFYNMASGKMGLVGIWDAVAFDEVADLQKMPKEVITTLKTYCESGSFARGKESLSGMASIAMFGNTNQPVEVMVRSSHLFMPMPDVIREDMAFLDRLHFYIPGWEIPKMRIEYFTDHYGFVVDYLAEALRELRKHNFTEMIDRHFSLGSHLNARDVKAVRKTVSGLVKLLYPHGEVTSEELAEMVELALEGRRRVKEQLKKMGSFE